MSQEEPNFWKRLTVAPRGGRQGKVDLEEAYFLKTYMENSGNTSKKEFKIESLEFRMGMCGGNLKLEI